MATAKKLDVHSATSDYSKTYVFHDEDHTLGNSLRYVLMRKYVSLSFSSYDGDAAAWRWRR